MKLCDFFLNEKVVAGLLYTNHLTREKFKNSMESSHKKPEWASHLMETVELNDLFRQCPLSEKDKKEIRKQNRHRRGRMEDYEKEDVYFWIGVGLQNHRQIFAVFAAYLNKYICQPDCCKNNESMIRMYIADSENAKIKEKLHSGEKMLEKIINMEKTFFPDDKDGSIFGKLQFFYNTFSNCCISCGEAFDGGECRSCATRCILLEELFHAENIWYNTGCQNVYTMGGSLYSRDMKQGFCLGLITQRLDKDEWYSPERATVRRFQGCNKRTKDRMPNLFPLCVNTIINHWDEEQISKLPLPPAIKKQIRDDLISPERHVINNVLGEYFEWVFPTDEMLSLRTRGCYFYTDIEHGYSC